MSKSPVRTFLDRHFKHFNARETVATAQAYEEHINAGGKMMVSLAGAMSTGELGIILARMIRQKKVHAISCTGANLEEDVFNLIANKTYELVPNWRGLSPEMEQDLLDRGFNRVTDTCIPENAMRHLASRLKEHWARACKEKTRKMPSEFIFDILRSGELKPHYQIDPQESWMVAAAECNIPVYSPGWEDSTTANMFTAAVVAKEVEHHLCVKTGTEQFQHLMTWYQEHCRGPRSVGFFQVGGGIAGDFAICVVPSLIQDLDMDIPLWGYFAQISDAVTSYGGYSGAVPNEKITWSKLAVDTPKFMIQSDASIVAPLIFAYVLGD